MTCLRFAPSTPTSSTSGASSRPQAADRDNVGRSGAVPTNQREAKLAPLPRASKPTVVVGLHDDPDLREEASRRRRRRRRRLRRRKKGQEGSGAAAAAHGHAARRPGDGFGFGGAAGGESLRALLPPSRASSCRSSSTPSTRTRCSSTASRSTRARRCSCGCGGGRSAADTLLARMSIELSAVHREKASGGDFLFFLFSVDRLGPCRVLGRPRRALSSASFVLSCFDFAYYAFLLACVHRAFPSFLFLFFSFFCCIFCHVPFLLEQEIQGRPKKTMAESLLKPLLPAMDDSGSYTAIGTAITGMKEAALLRRGAADGGG